MALTTITFILQAHVQAFWPAGIDFAWYYIRTVKFIGGVSACRDAKKQFMEDCHKPYLEGEEKG